MELSRGLEPMSQSVQSQPPTAKGMPVKMVMAASTKARRRVHQWRCVQAGLLGMLFWGRAKMLIGYTEKNHKEANSGMSHIQVSLDSGKGENNGHQEEQHTRPLENPGMGKEGGKWQRTQRGSACLKCLNTSTPRGNKTPQSTNIRIPWAKVLLGDLLPVVA
eukprot:GILI01001959.1.p2 GENE.GILI01001959.1~~GILI01001959.1.p2  ORF type:complete len:162 (-),score=22.90 GILI01001959.1:775-1260(-)